MSEIFGADFNLIVVSKTKVERLCNFLQFQYLVTDRVISQLLYIRIQDHFPAQCISNCVPFDPRLT